MNTSLEFESQNEEYGWQERRHSNNKNIGESGSSNCFSLGLYGNNPTANSNSSSNNKRDRGKYRKMGGFGLEKKEEEEEEDDAFCRVVPAVTVVVEGRSICHRISLHNHGSYESLAKALRHMLVDVEDNDQKDDNSVDLSNAIPGHLVAYEDMDNDLLLAGDLNWMDFVRVAKRIRILPAKRNSRKGTRRA